MKDLSTLKIYLVLVLLISILFLGIGCKKAIDPNDPDNEVCEFPLYPEAGNVRDTIRSCHFKATLHSAEYDPIEYRGPRVTVYVTIRLMKAMNGKAASVWGDSFIAKDGQGNRYAWKGLGDVPQKLLGEGGKFCEVVEIEVDKTASDFTLIFHESQSYGTAGYRDTIKWKLTF